MAKKFKVTLKRSLIGCTETQRHRHQSVVVADNPAMRGQIMKVQHMVDVQVEK
jgi:large subunit ribosomal protein L30